MNIEQINKWLVLFGNLGVIVGIFFLILELQQANRIAIGTAESDVRERFMTLSALVIENPDLASALTELSSDDADITPVQSTQVSAYVRNSIAFLMTVQTSFDNGLISENSFKAYLNVADRMIKGSPELAPFYSSALGVRGNVEENAMTSQLIQTIEAL